jgi:dinuclear metal center YbgI/SA1388 family protein
MAVKLAEVVEFLNRELDVEGVEDRSKNGLQVQGPPEVSCVALAVDACMEAFCGARAAGAELLVVHHGLFWGDVDGLRGVLYDRIRFLMEKDLGLYCVHLPLDRHPVVGHNARLCDLLDLKNRRGFAKVKGKTIGFFGRLPVPRTPAEIAATLRSHLGGDPTILAGSKERVETVGVISGGGGYDFWEALELGLDCFITGETCYSIFHDAVESGASVIFAGHYQTETMGLVALGELLEEKLGLRTVFVDIPGPAY